jgi:hypothetical protein
VRNALCSLKIGCAADEPNTAKWSSPSDDVLCLVTAAGLLSVLGSHQQTSVYVCQQQETKCKSQPSTKSCTKLILSVLSSCSSLNRADAQHFCPLHYRRSEVIKSGVKTPPSSVKSPPAQQFLLHFINVHTLQAPKRGKHFPSSITHHTTINNRFHTTTAVQWSSCSTAQISLVALAVCCRAQLCTLQLLPRPTGWKPADQNCSSSVEPCSAVVLDWPLAMACASSSK